MKLAMIGCAAICIIIGVFPQLLYGLLPYEVAYEPYYPAKVVFYLQLLLFSGLAFFVLLPLMKRTLTIGLDTDWVWRRGSKLLANLLLKAIDRFTATKDRIGTKTVTTLSYLTNRYLGQPHEADSEEKNVFARSWTIGTTALWISGLLSAYV